MSQPEPGSFTTSYEFSPREPSSSFRIVLFLAVLFLLSPLASFALSPHTAQESCPQPRPVCSSPRAEDRNPIQEARAAGEGPRAQMRRDPTERCYYPGTLCRKCSGTLFHKSQESMPQKQWPETTGRHHMVVDCGPDIGNHVGLTVVKTIPVVMKN